MNTHDAKTDIVEAVVAEVVVADSGAAVNRADAPRAATQQTKLILIIR